MSQGIVRLRLCTQRLAEVRAFYNRKLHFPIREEAKDSITFQAGTTELTFIRSEPNAGRPFYHFAFNIPENKLAPAQEWLAERTPLVTRENKEVVYHFPNWNAHAIYFWDPAGNLGELIARHDLANARGGPFTVDDVLYASEIGIVVEDVPAAVKVLKSRLSLPTYRPGTATFEPLGDEHRLLIVAQKGRPWIDRPAEVFPTAATLHGSEMGRCDLTGYPYALEAQPG